MKKLLTIMAACLMTLTTSAQAPRWPQQAPQGQQQFSPERFDEELKTFITREAQLTPQEAETFFPLYKEMQDKQRTLYGRQMQLNNTKPSDEAGCLNAIKESDDIDLELKNIQKTYHTRFLEVVSASKLYDILKAEQRFHRRMMRSWGGGNVMNQRRGRPQFHR